MVVLVCVSLVENVGASRSASSIYTPKEVMIRQWKDLCDNNPGLASYEVIGKSIQGRDIWLFAIGNASGGRIMYDGQVHGWEDGGTECMYKFARFLLESDDPLANHFLGANCNLFIPVVNVDTTNRQNMRSEYVLENGTVINVTYGVDLNRNGVYGWGRSGSDDPGDDYSYHGLYAGSEPETQAIRYAVEKYKPAIYLNTHLGASYVLHRSNTDFEANIEGLIVNNSQQLNVAPYSIRRGIGGGLIAADADESFGASGWLVEIEAKENLPDTLELFLEGCYPKVFAVFLAFNQAIAPPMESVQPPVIVEGEWRSLFVLMIFLTIVAVFLHRLKS